MRRLGLVLFGGMAFSLLPMAAPAQPLVAAVLPGSRSVQVSTPATAFATIINGGGSTALGCGITPITPIPATFTYQTTNPATNQLTGTPNTPVNIPAGGFQTFVIAFTPSAPFGPTDVQLNFNCANTSPANIVSGLNTLLLAGSSLPVTDVVALVATLKNDGIVDVSGPGLTGVFAVATVNVGAGSFVPVQVSADLGGVALPLTLALCQTNAATGQCLNSIVPSVLLDMASGSTFTFGVFVTAHGGIPFDPAGNRVFVRFIDSLGVVRGITSVAVRTVIPNIGGTYLGSGSFSQTNCQNPANNVTRAILVSGTIIDQGSGSFVGGFAVTYPGIPSQSTQVTATGSVTAAGGVSGSLVISTSVNGVAAASGDGTFTGLLNGSTLTLTFTGQTQVGVLCNLSGSVVMHR